MNFSVYLTIDPPWLTYPALAVFWLGLVLVAIVFALLAARLFARAIQWLDERGWL
jgi:hypothetical protein